MRICSECQEIMTEGFTIDAGREYYCSDYCLHQHYSQEDFEAMYSDGGDTYWTQWDETDHPVEDDAVVIAAIQRTLQTYRPSALPTQPLTGLTDWINLYHEAFNAEH